MAKFHATEFDFLPELAFRTGEKGRLVTLEGGKGSSAPAPNPMLEMAQISAINKQADISDRMLANSESLMPFQREQLQFGLDAARAAYTQSQEDRAYAIGHRQQLDSAMRPMLDEAASFNEGTRRSELMKEADADIGMVFGSAQDQQTRALARQGVSPTSGRAQALGQQAELAEATARATAGRKVSAAARAEGLLLNANAVNVLSGAPATAMQATAAGAGYGVAGLGLTNTALGGMNSGLGEAAGVANAYGAGAGSLYGTQLGVSTQANLAAANQRQELAGLAVGVGVGLLSGKKKW